MLLFWVKYRGEKIGVLLKKKKVFWLLLNGKEDFI